MNTLSRLAFGIWNGLWPTSLDGKPAPKALPYTFDFSTVGTYSDDLLTENTRGDMQFVQGVYIDNSDNPNPFTITFKITNQRIVVPARSQGTYMVMSPDQTQFMASTTPGNDVNGNPLKINVLFTNVPTAYTQWGPVTVNSAVTVNASFQPKVGAFSDAQSGTIATPGTSQPLFATNALAIRRIVQNPASNNESIFIQFGGIAAVNDSPSIEIPVGQKFDTGLGPIDTTAWTINATAAAKYTAQEMV